MDRRLSPFEWACLGVVAAAFLLRLMFLLSPEFIWDTGWFLMLARSWGETGTFLIRWSQPGAPEYSGYWPPLFPIFLSFVVKVFGADYRAAVIASTIAAGGLTAATFFCTRSLFDRPRAFAAMAMVAATPAFYVSDQRGMSESLLSLFVVLALWAFVKSLQKPAYMPLAGGFAFLAYLGKASLGLPIVGVLVIGLVAWRVSSRGWRAVVTSKWDVGLALAGLAALATIALTRSGQVGGLGVGIIDPLRRATAGAECSRFIPGSAWMGLECWFPVFFAKIVFVGAFLLVVTLPLSLRVRDALRAPRSERTDAIWLGALLPLVAGAVFTTSFFFTEHRNFVDFDNIRYLTPAFVPFLWVLLPHWDFSPSPTAADERSRALARRHWAWYAAAVGAMVLVLLLNPLTGTSTLGRFYGLLVISLAPLALSVGAASTRFAAQTREIDRNAQTRLVRDTSPGADRRVMAIAFVVLVATAWLFSSWYASVGIGLVVALAAASPRARVVGMAFILLASAAPSVQSPLPVEDAADALAHLPEGTWVGITDPAVYMAAVAPDNVQLRIVYLNQPIPDDIDVFVAISEEGDRSYEGFTPTRAWNYTIWLSPPVAARAWVEENVLGMPIEYPQQRALTIFERNATASS